MSSPTRTNDLSAPSPLPIVDESSLPPIINQFTSNIINALNKDVKRTSQNLFCSPLSLFMALAMATNGAATSTLEQMANTLCINPAELPKLNTALQDFNDRLGSAARAQGVACELASSIWTAPGLAPRVKPEFRQIMQRVFQSDAFPLPDTPGPVNQWIEGKTHGKIRDVLGEIDPLTVLLLINAVYFKGAWQSPFDPVLTTPQPFHSFGSTARVPMMSRSGSFGYCETPQYQCCDLPYGRRGEFVATVVLPRDVRGIDALIAQGVLQHSSVTGGKRKSPGNVLLPRFRMTWAHTFNATLQQLGMRAPFSSSAADFSDLIDAVAPSDEVHISSVLQKAFVEVNEQGTEAAAATCVALKSRCRASREPWELRCDHPFLFLIRKGRAILFVGRVASV